MNHEAISLGIGAFIACVSALWRGACVFAKQKDFDVLTHKVEKLIEDQHEHELLTAR